MGRPTDTAPNTAADDSALIERAIEQTAQLVSVIHLPTVAFILRAHLWNGETRDFRVIVLDAKGYGFRVETPWHETYKQANTVRLNLLGEIMVRAAVWYRLQVHHWSAINASEPS